MAKGAIDTDGHVMEPDSMWLEYLDPSLHPMAPRTTTDNQGFPRQIIAGELMPYLPRDPEWQKRDPEPRGGDDPKARLEDMDLDGIESVMLIPTIGLYFGGLKDLRATGALCRAYNDWVYDYCDADRSRLFGVAMVPQGDILASVAEARRAVEKLGFRSVMLRPNPIAGRNIDDPYYDPLWTLLEELNVPVSLHEGTTGNLVQSGGDRFQNYAYIHACSHPHEQQMACMALICGGVLERHPGLRISILEAGCGWISSWLERLDEHMESWHHTTLKLPLTPSEYFARQCFISVDPEERSIPGVISLMGDDTLLFASDYPHPDGMFPGAVRAIDEREDLSAESKEKILRTNAQKCYGLA